MRILLKNMATSRINIILIKICCFRQITHINNICSMVKLEICITATDMLRHRVSELSYVRVKMRNFEMIANLASILRFFHRICYLPKIESITCKCLLLD